MEERSSRENVWRSWLSKGAGSWVNEGAVAVVLGPWVPRGLLLVEVGTAVAVEDVVLRVGEGGVSRAAGVRPRGVHSGYGLLCGGGVEEFWSLEGEVRAGW